VSSSAKPAIGAKPGSDAVVTVLTGLGATPFGDDEYNALVADLCAVLS
jgi:hypothetical protein